jgi:hypothetical protein
VPAHAQEDGGLTKETKPSLEEQKAGAKGLQQAQGRPCPAHHGDQVGCGQRNKHMMRGSFWQPHVQEEFGYIFK